MKKIILIIIVFNSVFVMASNNDSTFINGNNLYKKELYKEAIQIYQSIENFNLSSSICHNIGNCYYKIGEVPKAILFYEKSIKINSNIGSKKNLEIASKRIKKIEAKPNLFFVNWWIKTVNLYNSNIWLLIILINIWVLSFSILFFLIKRNKSSVYILFLFSILLFLNIFLTKSSIDFNKIKYGIILDDVNFNNKNEKILIPKGNKVKILETKNNNLHIEIPSGDTGWIEDLSLSEI